MCSPEEEQPNRGMAANEVPPAEQFAVRRSGANGNTVGARHGGFLAQCRA
jgi:hypothetical protein